MKKILTLGLGKVGTLVATLLSKDFEVVGIDKQAPHYDYELPFTVLQGDVSDHNFMEKHISECDAVVSALPYFLNKPIATIAHIQGKHYFLRHSYQSANSTYAVLRTPLQPLMQ